jgi:adenine-specific DNA-methyltransferase
MKNIFLAGSKVITSVPDSIKGLIKKHIELGDTFIVGDCTGADVLFQKYLLELEYSNVTVFCSGPKCRNNLGQWRVHNVYVPNGVTAFDFHLYKDKELASFCDSGIMLWDKQSIGTGLNINRLIDNFKPIDVYINTTDTTWHLHSKKDWKNLLNTCNKSVQSRIDYLHNQEI